LPSACSFIVDGFHCLAFSFTLYTTCFGLHGHLQVCMMFYFYIPEGRKHEDKKITNPLVLNYFLRAVFGIIFLIGEKIKLSL
jgi:hypothetical protein